MCVKSYDIIARRHQLVIRQTLSNPRHTFHHVKIRNLCCRRHFMFSKQIRNQYFFEHRVFIFEMLYNHFFTQLINILLKS